MKSYNWDHQMDLIKFDGPDGDEPAEKEYEKDEDSPFRPMALSKETMEQYAEHVRKVRASRGSQYRTEKI